MSNSSEQDDRPLSEYERIRARAEAEAIKAEAMTRKSVGIARDVGARLAAECGLKPARVWDMTRHMRAKENGGMR